MILQVIKVLNISFTCKMIIAYFQIFASTTIIECISRNLNLKYKMGELISWEITPKTKSACFLCLRNSEFRFSGKLSLRRASKNSSLDSNETILIRVGIAHPIVELISKYIWYQKFVIASHVFEIRTQRCQGIYW